MQKSNSTALTQFFSYYDLQEIHESTFIYLQSSDGETPRRSRITQQNKSESELGCDLKSPGQSLTMTFSEIIVV